MPHFAPREQYYQRRRYAIGAALLVYCCCFLLVVGLAIALGVVASSSSPTPPPPSPTPAIGACCRAGEETICEQLTDEKCNDDGDQFYGVNSSCSPDTCLVPPKQCLCEDHIVGKSFVSSVLESTILGACIDIVLTFECIDQRTDTRCASHLVPYNFIVINARDMLPIRNVGVIIPPRIGNLMNLM